MSAYFFKRLFLIIPTFLGATALLYFILSIAPGGPFARAVMQLKMTTFQQNGETPSGQFQESKLLSPAVLEQLKHQYGLDQPWWKRYLIWLGLYPRTVSTFTIPLNTPIQETLRYISHHNHRYALQRWIQVVQKDGMLHVLESGVGGNIAFADFPKLPHHTHIIDWEASHNWHIQPSSKTSHQFHIERRNFQGIFTGDFGNSYIYHEPVLKLIQERLPISCWFGITSFLLSYLICIPLGVLKALKHGSHFDWVSSLLIFIGYAIPGYVLGILLLFFLGGGSFLDWFPLGEFRSAHFDTLSTWEKIKDQLHHMILPIIAYTMGSFATLTLLTKNALLEQLHQDYVRFAIAKGLRKRRVIFVHALRNALIPLVTGIGHVIGIFLSGSYLIEKVFNIDGIGYLGFQSILQADYPVVLAFLVLNTFILLVGNLLSDMSYAWVDPRIRLDR